MPIKTSSCWHARQLTRFDPRDRSHSSRPTISSSLAPDISVWMATTDTSPLDLGASSMRTAGRSRKAFGSRIRAVAHI